MEFGSGKVRIGCKAVWRFLMSLEGSELYYSPALAGGRKMLPSLERMRLELLIWKSSSPSKDAT